MNPQVPGYQTGAPPAWGAGAPAGATVVAPPAYAPPQPPAASPRSLPPPQPTPSPGWIAVWTMFTIALLLAATAVGLSVAKLTTQHRDDNHSHRRTAAPTVQPQNRSPPPKKKSVTPASTRTSRSPLRSATFSAPHSDRQSPEYRPALSNFQLVASIETAFLERHLTPAVPKDVKDATNGYIAATLALVDANTRELSDQDAQPFVVATRESGDQLDKVCE